ncbi:hypothetical protein K491DRAFT_590343 [Lophiostoma macrostomum CBS 122681]|uniref:Methyltransferase domain-containing protein n=1 Tax=Lophiostoma macrostomum CBS 122681 TaxID=1314788 RepID=A0A6A6TK36_9PLEO|nr:hypothetical protein K491DRAFT_590343 [Lophiostoma macrostomum CBS 122681]
MADRINHEKENLAKLDPQSWLIKDPNLQPDARELFEKYSKIPPDDVVRYITEVRDKAFKVFPYPCLGHWGFIELTTRQSPQFGEALERIKAGDKYLDIGCCVGQDIRKLTYEGAPSENMYGSDLRKEFMDIGYELFRDQDTLKATFIAADIFDPDSDLRSLDGKIDIVNAGSFFHLWEYDDQVKAAKRVVALLKPQPGSLIMGRQVGNVNAGASAKSNTSRFRHSPETWSTLWKRVGEETGTQWDVNAYFTEIDLSNRKGFNFTADTEGMRRLMFSVRRL